MTQYEKIIDFMSDGNWHCQSEFWKHYIFSPHKRRKEIENKGKYIFEEVQRVEKKVEQMSLV